MWEKPEARIRLYQNQDILKEVLYFFYTERENIDSHLEYIGYSKDMPYQESQSESSDL